MFLPIYYQPASIILTQAKAMGYEPTFFGVDGMDGILTMPGFDASLAEGVMLLTPFSVNSEDAATQSFVKTYTEKYGVEPNQFAADAYDGVYIVKAALEKAGCTADMSSTDICEALIQVMPTLSVDGLTGKAMTWNAEGEVSKAPCRAWSSRTASTVMKLIQLPYVSYVSLFSVRLPGAQAPDGRSPILWRKQRQGRGQTLALFLPQKRS